MSRRDDLHYNSHQPRTMTTSFITETADQELNFSDLNAINGGGKKAKKKVGKWLEKTFGNGDGEHTFSDYADEVIKIITVVAGASGGNVHQPPGEDDPRPGVEY